ncbi:hypothetical protein K501DRAFT_205733, partial [Backusella circina FSU 941]
MFEAGYGIEMSDPLKLSKLRYESAIYIVFEVWRLWLVLDGIIQMNSLTIYATAALAVLSVGLSLVTLNEYSRLNNGITDSEKLIFINIVLQIAFSGVLFIFAIPTLWYAYKVKKDFGWGVYKKIGGSLELQRMYQVAQCLSLILKLDIFFELAFIIVLTISFGSSEYFGIFIPTPILTLISIIIVRESIARESHILMILSLLLQVEFIVAVTYFLFFRRVQSTASEFVFTDWYAFASFFICSSVSFLITIMLAIWCLINFNKGLKAYVQWSFFGLKTLFN